MTAVPLLLPRTTREWTRLVALASATNDWLGLNTAREFHAGLFPSDDPPGMAGTAVAAMNYAMRRVRGLIR